MEQDFEHYAEARIPLLKANAAALMAEAEALQKALADFRASKRGNGQEAAMRQVANTGTLPATGRPVSPGSQSQNILTVLEEAGATGRTITELYDALAERGVTNNRASVRSVVWTLKKSGKIVPNNDRYFVAPHHGS